MRVLFLVIAALFIIAPHNSEAAFLFCNKTGVTIEAAFGWRDDSSWISEGWWQIQPGQCARALTKPLNQRFYFYHARALVIDSESGQAQTWGGKYRFCVDEKAFRIEGDKDCTARGFTIRGFHEVDIGRNTRNYTLNFMDNK